MTELLHRIRLADPTAGLWEAADFQWWWRTPRPSDHIEQRFWLDADGPVAGATLTDWGGSWGLDPIVIPTARSSFRHHVWGASLRAVGELPAASSPVAVETRVRDGDLEVIGFLTEHGFVASGADGTAWMEISKRRPRVAPGEGFEIGDRGAHPLGPHWMTHRSGPSVEARLRETTLYDPWLDLCVRTPDGEVAGYALFWFDPVTHVGMLEPMRVEEAWQRRGIARALIAEGVERLAMRGATRVKVSFESDAARALYLGAGFELESTSTVYSRMPSVAPQA